MFACSTSLTICCKFIHMGFFFTFLNMFQVLSKEREIQRTREIKEEFSSRIHNISEKLKAISAKFKEKSPDVDHAKEEAKVG